MIRYVGLTHSVPVDSDSRQSASRHAKPIDLPIYCFPTPPPPFPVCFFPRFKPGFTFSLPSPCLPSIPSFHSFFFLFPPPPPPCSACDFIRVIPVCTSSFPVGSCFVGLSPCPLEWSHGRSAPDEVECCAGLSTYLSTFEDTKGAGAVGQFHLSLSHSVQSL